MLSRVGADHGREVRCLDRRCDDCRDGACSWIRGGHAERAGLPGVRRDSFQSLSLRTVGLSIRAIRCGDLSQWRGLRARCPRDRQGAPSTLSEGRLLALREITETNLFILGSRLHTSKVGVCADDCARVARPRSKLWMRSLHLKRKREIDVDAEVSMRHDCVCSSGWIWSLTHAGMRI